MIQTEILDKFVQLPAKEQLEVIEASASAQKFSAGRSSAISAG